MQSYIYVYFKITTIGVHNIIMRNKSMRYRFKSRRSKINQKQSVGFLTFR